MVVCFVDIGRLVDHHCLEVDIFVFDIGGLVDHHCLEMVVRLLILVDLLIITV